MAVALPPMPAPTVGGGRTSGTPVLRRGVDLSGTWGPRFVYALDPNPPMLPGALTQFKAADPDDDPVNRCKPPRDLRITNMAFPFEIVQTRDVVYLLFE